MVCSQKNRKWQPVTSGETSGERGGGVVDVQYCVCASGSCGVKLKAKN